MMDDLIDRVVEELRRPVRPSPAFDARMTEQLRAASHRRRRRVTSAWTWLRQPRTVHLSPLGALGIVAAAVVMVILTRTLTTALGAASHVAANAPAAVPAGPIVSAAEHDGVEMVRFVFLAPNARSV